MYKHYQPDGYRQLITLSCPSNIKREDFRVWFLEHSERVKYLPGLKWYTLCFTFDTIDYSDGSPGRPLQFDFYEELYFASLNDLKKAYGSDLMKQELKDMAGNGLVSPDYMRGVWAEANIIKMNGLVSPPKQKNCARIFGGCKCTDRMTKRKLKDWYHAHADRVIDHEGSMIITEIIGYIHNFTIEDSPFGKPFVDAYCNNWWATKEDMLKTFKGDVWNGQLEHREEHIDIQDSSLFIGATAMEHIVDLPDC
jgi:hypothetical protein